VERGVNLDDDPVEEGGIEEHGEGVAGLLGLGLVERRSQPFLATSSCIESRIISRWS
jgi:hypothetical protein